MTKRQKPMMRRRDAATYIDRSPNTVRRLFKEGILEGEHGEDGVLWLTVESLDRFNANPVPKGRPAGTGLKKPARSKAKQKLREYNRDKQRERRARMRQARAGRKAAKQGAASAGNR